MHYVKSARSFIPSTFIRSLLFHFLPWPAWYFSKQSLGTINFVWLYFMCFRYPQPLDIRVCYPNWDWTWEKAKDWIRGASRDKLTTPANNTKFLYVFGSWSFPYLNQKYSDAFQTHVSQLILKKRPLLCGFFCDISYYWRTSTLWLIPHFPLPRCSASSSSRATSVFSLSYVRWTLSPSIFLFPFLLDSTTLSSIHLASLLSVVACPLSDDNRAICRW